jgi:hypothetical protein
VPEIELGVREQREAELAGDRLDGLASDDELGRVLAPPPAVQAGLSGLAVTIELRACCAD